MTFKSLFIAWYWHLVEKKAIRYVKANHPNRILDIATGTADLAIEAKTIQKLFHCQGRYFRKMLEIGKKK